MADEHSTAPPFAGLVVNQWASLNNPKRVGRFVRVVRSRARMNGGTWWQLTDGRGAFWQIRPESCHPAVKGEDYGPGCGNTHCPCQAPGRPCGEWQGIDGETGTWCPRCGWARQHHPAAATAGEEAGS